MGAYDKADDSTGRKEKSVETGVDEEKVMCFCGEDCEFGEIACCELCAGWFHFRCIRFKEDVDMLAKKNFVCCFCLASKTLFLLREVEALKSEMKELRERNSAEKGVIPTNENDGKAESVPGNQASAIHEKSYAAPELDGVVTNMMQTESCLRYGSLCSSFAGSTEGSLRCGERVLLCLYPRSKSGECVMLIHFGVFL